MVIASEALQKMGAFASQSSDAVEEMGSDVVTASNDVHGLLCLAAQLSFQVK